MRLLLIEDDESLSGVLRSGLSRRGYDVTVAANGARGEELARSNQYDILVVDWMLPGRDGLTVVKNLRATGSKVPVLMLTALEDVERVVAALEAGADDYLTKPFEFKELFARIGALTRRASALHPAAPIQLGPLQLDPLQRKAQVDGQPLSLRSKEFAVLELLARCPNEAVDRNQLASEIWRAEFDEVETTLYMTVSTLRKKLSKVTATHPDMPAIQTVRGVGYRLSPRPDRRDSELSA